MYSRTQVHEKTNVWWYHYDLVVYIGFPLKSVHEYTKVIVTITVVAYYIVCIRPFGPFGPFVFTLPLIDSSELAKKRCFEKWHLHGSARMPTTRLSRMHNIIPTFTVVDHYRMYTLFWTIRTIRIYSCSYRERCACEKVMLWKIIYSWLR